MSYKISIRRGALAIGAGLALVAAMACLAAAPVQPGTVEVTVSPPPPTATAAPATPANLPGEPKEVRAIRLANDPSEAVQAYAGAIKVNDKNPAIYDMYIRRMMGFRLFEILGAPAQELVKLDPNNGLGWSVLGFTMARQGNMPAAFDDAVKAVNASPKDPFVLQFAGQLVGWYSHQAGQEGLPPTILQSVLKLREFAAQPAYVQGYTAASNAIQPPARWRQRPRRRRRTRAACTPATTRRPPRRPTPATTTPIRRRQPTTRAPPTLTTSCPTPGTTRATTCLMLVPTTADTIVASVSAPAFSGARRCGLGTGSSAMTPTTSGAAAA